MWSRTFKPGDEVVYRKSKQSKHPGRRAQAIRACRKGDNYAYFVDKFWIVMRVSSGQLLVATRRGKTRVINQGDPNLRHPSAWERLRYRSRFAQLRHVDVAD